MQRFLPPSTSAGDSIRFIVRSVGVVLVALMALAIARPVMAGWVPAYVTASGRPDGVLLAWGTVSEYNLSGFEILCKLESEPEDAFHPIGSRPAVGSLDAGADYQFPVNSGLEPGLTYCFRIREIAFTEEPPEFVDLCGYGININPPGAAGTPIGSSPGSVEVLSTAVFTTTPPPVQPIGGTPTPITINPAAPTGTFTAPATATPTATVIGAAPAVTPFPTVTPLPSPTPTQAGESPPQTGSDATTSPLGTPTQNAQSDAATSPLANQSSAAADAGESPLMTGAQQDENAQSPLESPSPTPTWTALATATWTPMATATLPPSTGQESMAADSPVGGGVAQGDDANPAYIVVTATPTPPETTPDATFTPLPTATPLPDSRLLATAADPTVENLILMTLCFIFLGAGGIGALGLTTTVLYIRSRNDRSR